MKTINNPQGPHALVSEFVGYELARWIQLKTPPFRIHDFGEQSRIIVMSNGQRGVPGHSFVTDEVDGRPWDGTAKDFEDNVENQHDVIGLIILDTWLRNIDRYVDYRSPIRRNNENVFLVSREGPSKRHMVAFDHSEALREGGGELKKTISAIDRIKDEHVYGMFPEFVQFIDGKQGDRFLERLALFDQDHARTLVRAIPDTWDVSREVREAISVFLYELARFLCTHIPIVVKGPPEQLKLFREGSGHV